MAVVARKRPVDVLSWGAGQLGSSSTPRYLYPGYSDQLAETHELGLHVARSGILRKLQVRHNVPDGNGNDIIYTVRVVGVDSLLQVVLASTAVLGSDLSNTVPVGAGDYLSIRVNKAAGVARSPRDVVVTAEFA